MRSRTFSAGLTPAMQTLGQPLPRRLALFAIARIPLVLTLAVEETLMLQTDAEAKGDGGGGGGGGGGGNGGGGGGNGGGGGGGNGGGGVTEAEAAATVVAVVATVAGAAATAAEAVTEAAATVVAVPVVAGVRRAQAESQTAVPGAQSHRLAPQWTRLALSSIETVIGWVFSVRRSAVLASDLSSLGTGDKAPSSRRTVLIQPAEARQRHRRFGLRHVHADVAHRYVVAVCDKLPLIGYAKKPAVRSKGSQTSGLIHRDERLCRHGSCDAHDERDGSIDL